MKQNEFESMTFKRKFCVNLFKNTKLNLAKMTFTKDWITTDRGNAYPVMESSGNVEEAICENKYIAKTSDKSFVKRLIGQYVPFATYEVTANNISDGACVGVSVNCEKIGKSFDVFIKRVNSAVRVFYSVGGNAVKVTEEDFEYKENMSLVVTSHHGDRLDIFVRYDNCIKKVAFFRLEGFSALKNESCIQKYNCVIVRRF